MEVFTQNTIKLEQEMVIILTWTCIYTKMIPFLLYSTTYDFTD